MFVLALLALGLALAILVARWLVRRRTRDVLGQSATTFWSALGVRPDGRPTVVAFSTPSCAACHAAQVPALRALERQVGPESLRVLRVDAAARPEVARAFGVLTVPSTAIFGSDGRLTALNHGFTPIERLAAQVAPLA